MATKTLPSGPAAQKTLDSPLRSLSCTNWMFKMLCSRFALPLLALYLLLDEISAAVIARNKREANWLHPDPSDQADLSLGDAESGHFSGQRRDPHQSQCKASEKRRKVAPLDSIGSFQMSTTRNRKDKPDVYRGHD